MNFQKLQVFLSLCETLNYTETAEQLYTTQGSISKQIIALEKDLGITLFNRKHRQIALTEEGQMACRYAQTIMATYEEMMETLAQLSSQKAHKITIHGIPTMPAYTIIEEIANFQKQHPDYQVIVEEEESDQILHSLDEGLCDAVFVRSFGGEIAKQYDSIFLGTDRLVAVLPCSHALAGADKINLEKLKTETFFQLGHKTQLLQQVMTLCQTHGFTPQIGYQGNRVDLIIDFVEKELGVSIMMEKSVASFKNRGIVCIPLDTDVVSELNLLRLKSNHSPALLLFWEEMVEKYSQKE